MRGCSVVLIALLSLVASCLAVDLRHRSVSSSGQFVIYCDDRGLRSQIVGFVEANKGELLRVLQETDDWKLPIVVAFEPESESEPKAPPVVTTLVSTIAGPKIDLMVRLGEDPTKVTLQRNIVHALVLEMAYREKEPMRDGQRYAEPPWWLVEGFIQIIRSRNGISDPDVFKSIVNTEKLPSLEKILTQPPMRLDAAAGAVDRACALALVEALLRLPNGPKNLVRFIRAWPESDGDAVTLLAKHFPTLGDSSQTLAKWWTLQLAASGQSGQWHGMSPEESDAELNKLLQLDVSIGKPPRNERFALSNFEQFVKTPGARPALRVAQVRIVTLQTKSHIIFQPVLSEYEEICGLLSNGKTKGVAERLESLERQRRSLLQRFGQITDYVNWYEATQTPGTTGQFERYLRAVENLRPKPQAALRADPRATEYLDSLEEDFAPLRPNMLPGPQPVPSSDTIPGLPADLLPSLIPGLPPMESAGR